MSAELVALLYLVAGVLFILALRGLSSPETSRQGNYMAMSGMAIAVVTTLAVAQPATALSWALIVGGIAVGGTIGAVIARRWSRQRRCHRRSAPKRARSRVGRRQAW